MAASIVKSPHRNTNWVERIKQLKRIKQKAIELKLQQVSTSNATNNFGSQDHHLRPRANTGHSYTTHHQLSLPSGTTNEFADKHEPVEFTKFS